MAAGVKSEFSDGEFFEEESFRECIPLVKSDVKLDIKDSYIDFYNITVNLGKNKIHFEKDSRETSNDYDYTRNGQ